MKVTINDTEYEIPDLNMTNLSGVISPVTNDGGLWYAILTEDKHQLELSAPYTPDAKLLKLTIKETDELINILQTLRKRMISE